MKLNKEQKELINKILHSPESIKKRTEILQKQNHFVKMNKIRNENRKKI